jgi:hypothetical protein
MFAAKSQEAEGKRNQCRMRRRPFAQLLQQLIDRRSRSGL